MRLASVPFLCACVACLYLAGCYKKRPPRPLPCGRRGSSSLRPTSLGSWPQGAGRIQSRYDSQVGFEVGGRLVSRDVDIGAVVTKGQKLAKLSAIDYRNKVTAAEAELAAAKAARRPGCAPGGALPHPARARAATTRAHL